VLPARAALLIALLACGLAAPAQAQTPTPTPAPAPTPEPRIAPGVSAAGVDLSNLTIPEATAKLEQTLTAALQVPVSVSVAGHRAKLKVKATKFAFDAARTARRAYNAGVNQPPPPQQPAAGGTAPPPVDVALAVRFRHAVVRDFALAIGKAVHAAPRDASIRITLRKMIRRHSHPGRDTDANALRTQIEQALSDPRLPRVFKPGRHEVAPRVTVKDLPRIYGTVITIEKATFKLRLFKRLRLSKTYGVATGMPAYPTPSGLFNIQNKQVNPTWTAPNSPWAGEMAGQSVSGGAANNPLKARWMGIANGVGIHGTGQEWSIGSQASHGCLRMRVADVIDLYPRVPVGTPVLIK
jgi:lipoprotein-anchoring transpeptidase ErfK/SrfK